VAGLFGAVSVLAGLLAKPSAGGQRVDVSLLQSTLAVLVNQAQNAFVSGRSPGRRGNAHPNIVPYETFATADGEILKKVGIELDPAGRTVKVGGKEISLTRKEFDLLSVLISKAGRVLSVNYLLETVWGYDPADYNDPGTVEVHVSHLRKKLGPKLAKRIVAVIGHGYKFED